MISNSTDLFNFWLLKRTYFPRMLLFILYYKLMFVLSEEIAHGFLYPRDSETREVRSLDGIWNFRVAPTDKQNLGYCGRWYLSDLSKTGAVETMPVPSSYNDISQKSSIRDHIGVVWYDRRFFTPGHWAKEQRRVFIRFGSVHYHAKVWINGVLVITHEGGHLPFQVDITAYLKFSKTYDRVTVAVNNTLTPSTIPQGIVKVMNDTNKYPHGYLEQSYNFDFFNYAGIHRPVLLFTTPVTYIDDIIIRTNFSPNHLGDDSNPSTGFLEVNVSFVGGINEENALKSNINCQLSLYEGWDLNGIGNEEKTEVTSSFNCKSLMIIPKVKLWWPHLMDPNPGYLYTLKVKLIGEGEDIYRMPVGVRTVQWSRNKFLINGKPFYFQGFGRHEDSNIYGRGLNLPLSVKDNNLLYWIGANSFRTSHYPYSEETMDFADRLGIVVINESPGIGISNFTDHALLKKHKKIMTELIQRDKNRPSVVLWSLANEPLSEKEGADTYFSELVNHTKRLDSARPVTFVTSQSFSNDKAVQFMDVICVNRYSGWYSDTGHTELIVRQTESELSAWNKKFNKPVIMTEYGAGSLSGFHSDPASVWTEEYHMKTLIEHFKAFDVLRQKGFLVGEMIWNFADFATPAEYFRPGGCMKGVFTRDRKPKLSAHVTRWHYWTLANQSFSVPLPKDLLFFQ